MPLAVADIETQALADLAKYRNYRANALRIRNLAALTDQEYHAMVEFYFLRSYQVLEWAIEQTFLSYMLGVPNKSGAAVACHAAPTDFAHALRMVTGTSEYVKWGQPSVVNELAENFFGPGNCFQFAFGRSPELAHMRKLRNCVAHQTTSTVRAYQEAVVHYFGSLRAGMERPAGLLLNSRPSGNPRPLLFNYFSTQVETLVRLIVA